MVRWLASLAAGICIAATPSVYAAPTQLDGTWKLSILGPDQTQSLYHVTLEAKQGKLTGSVPFTSRGIPPSTAEDVTLQSGRLHIVFKSPQLTTTFEGKVGEDDTKVIFGSLDIGPQLVAAKLERTSLKNPKDKLDAGKQIVAGSADSPELFEAALSLLAQAGKELSKPEEVRGWADKAFKSAERFGPRWHRNIGHQIAERLLNQDGFAAIGLEYARRTERLVEPSEPAAAQLRYLSLLATALRKNDKKEELGEIEKRIDQLETQAYQQYQKTMPPFAVAPFAGRKGNSERVALVELFTGSECPPCVAADVGFDAVEKAYKPTDVVLLQYHLHIPRPDPLTNPTSEERMKYYDIDSTPSIILNGRPGPQIGGPLGLAKEGFAKYREAIDTALEKPAPGGLRVSATRTGQRLDIAADTSDWQETGEKVRLRLALVEDVVRFRGGNGQIYHHCVIRALPGGERGIAVADKTAKQTANVDLDKLRKDLNQYLNQVANETPFSSSERPMDMRHLRVVAFVQNDGTKEVLQAAQADVPTNGKVVGN